MNNSLNNCAGFRVQPGTYFLFTGVEGFLTGIDVKEYNIPASGQPSNQAIESLSPGGFSGVTNHFKIHSSGIYHVGVHLSTDANLWTFGLNKNGTHYSFLGRGDTNLVWGAMNLPFASGDVLGFYAQRGDGSAGQYIYEESRIYISKVA